MKKKKNDENDLLLPLKPSVTVVWVVVELEAELTNATRAAKKSQEDKAMTRTRIQIIGLMAFLSLSLSHSLYLF